MSDVGTPSLRVSMMPLYIALRKKAEINAHTNVNHAYNDKKQVLFSWQVNYYCQMFMLLPWVFPNVLHVANCITARSIKRCIKIRASQINVFA